jgi:hypothetical protein
VNALRISTLAVVVMLSQGCAIFSGGKIDPMAAAREAERIKNLGAQAT